MIKSIYLEFRDKLILIFFNNFRFDYFIGDLMKLLSLNSSMLNIRLEQLIHLSYLQINEYAVIRITEKGEKLLKDNNLGHISIPELLKNIEEEEGKSETCSFAEALDEIYIPIHFDKKTVL